MKEEEGARTIACPHKVSCYFITREADIAAFLYQFVPSYIMLLFGCVKCF